MKKFLLSILIVLSIFIVVPTFMPIFQDTYSVQAASISLNKTKLTLNVNETYTLKIKGTSKKVKWSSSNTKIATVNSKGKIVAKSKGKVYISAKVAGKTYKCKVVVENPYLKKTSVKLVKGQKYTLTLKNTSQKIQWYSYNTKIATVNSNGRITAKSKGKVYIVAKVGKTKYKCKVNVETPSISKSSITLKQGNTYTLKMKNTTLTASWSSSNTKIAKVNSKGVVKAISTGTATITAKINGIKYKCNVTVPEPDYTAGIQVTYTKLHDSLIVAIKNNNPCQIDYVSVDVYFYKGSTLIDTRSTISACVAKNSTIYEQVSFPTDDNYDYVDFDTVKFIVKEANVYTYNPYTDLKKSLTIQHNAGTGNKAVIGTITNTGNTEIDTVELCALFYKDGKLVGYNSDINFSLKAGSTSSFEIYKDLNYSTFDYVDYDSYKLYLNSAYTY